MKRFYANAVTVPGPTLQRIGEAAVEGSAYVVIGVTEIDGGTLYNTLVYLGPDGRLLQRHRKLMPTGGERTVWGWETAPSSAPYARRSASSVRCCAGKLHASCPGGDLRTAL